jgi:hypothetical protein
VSGVDGLRQLDALATKLEDVARLGDEGPELAADAIQTKARAQYAAGRSPMGDRWAPRKKDGQPALARAPEHVSFTAIGDDIVQHAPEHYKFHRTGTKRMVKRNVYTEGRVLPTSWRAAVEQALEREFVRRLR